MFSHCFKITTCTRLFRLCKGEKVTHVRGKIRGINICSISGSVYTNTVREVTVMSLCTFWTTPIMPWLCDSSVCDTTLSSSLRNNIPMTKNSYKDSCLSNGQPKSLSYSGYNWCLSVFQSSPGVSNWLCGSHFDPGKAFRCTWIDYVVVVTIEKEIPGVAFGCKHSSKKARCLEAEGFNCRQWLRAEMVS